MIVCMVPGVPGVGSTCWYLQPEASSGEDGQYADTSHTMDTRDRVLRVQVDSGMVIVIFICMMYIVLVFGLLFYVKNDWCELLFKNMTVGRTILINLEIFSF